MEFYGNKYIEVGNLSQSGRSVEKIWRKGLKQALNRQSSDYRHKGFKILLLGVAGGTIVKVINDIFPGCQITGVDIDPMMIKAGKEYFGLADYKNLEIIIADAEKFVVETEKKYDLIIVDLFLGRNIPEFTGESEFLLNLKKSLPKNGYVIFNRLYFQKYKNEAEIFLDKVQKIINDVFRIKVDFNLFIVAR